MHLAHRGSLVPYIATQQFVYCYITLSAQQKGLSSSYICFEGQIRKPYACRVRNRQKKFSNVFYRSFLLLKNALLTVMEGEVFSLTLFKGFYIIYLTLLKRVEEGNFSLIAVKEAFFSVKKLRIFFCPNLLRGLLG